MTPEANQIIIGSIIWIVVIIFGNTTTFFGIEIENPILKKVTIFVLFPLTGHILIVIGKIINFFGHTILSPAIYLKNLLF